MSNIIDLSLNELVDIDYVIQLVVPHEVIIERISQRWIHAPSGKCSVV